MWLTRMGFFPARLYPMGAAGVASILRAFDCECCSDCAKYVLNDFRLHSKCSDCCEFDIETDEVAIPAASDSEHEQLEVEGCLRWSRGS